MKEGCKDSLTCQNKAPEKREFVCVEVLRPRQPNGVMSSAVSLPNYTFIGQAKSSKRLTSIVHILSPETDNCPLNQRKGENDHRKYFMINLHERMLPTSAGVEPATSWSRRTRIQLSRPLSHRGRQKKKKKKKRRRRSIHVCSFIYFLWYFFFSKFKAFPGYPLIS